MPQRLINSYIYFIYLFIYLLFSLLAGGTLPGVGSTGATVTSVVGCVASRGSLGKHTTPGTVCCNNDDNNDNNDDNNNNNDDNNDNNDDNNNNNNGNDFISLEGIICMFVYLFIIFQCASI